jgi:hypothetical protein
VIVLFLYQHNLVAVNAMVVLSIIIDIGDGIIFNKSRFAENRYLRESRRIWDGTLDRFIIWTTLLFALITIHFPLTLFTIIMVREFAVCLTTGLPYIRHAFVHSPNLPSKLGAVLIAAQLISFNQAAMIPLWLTFTFLALSGVGLVLYVVRPRQI